MKPNIVIFMTDQWRGDYTGAAGHPIIRTPNYDRMADEGMVFNQTYVTNPVCTPSRCSFCTGWYPHTRGHRSQDFLIDECEPHLFSYLRKAGYHIAWGGKNDMLTDQAIRGSVDTRLRPAGGGSTWGGRLNADGVPFPLDDPRYYSFYFGKMDGTMEEQTDVQVVRAAQGFPRNPPGEPFCLWVNTTFPHPPYAAPEPFFSMYAPEDMDAPICPAESPGEPAYMSILRNVSRMEQVDRGHFDRIKALYCGMTTMMDRAFGELMAALRETGAYDNTAVFLTSDHGNYNGDYGLPEKWFIAFQDAILRVPLGIRLPGQTQHGINHSLVQHFDVFATILDVVGIEPAWPHFGRSLFPIASGQCDSIRDAVFADAGANLVCDEPISIERAMVAGFTPECCYYPNKVLFQNHPETACRSMMIRTDRWKYIWRQQDTDELYDLDSDPQERANLLAGEVNGQVDSVRPALQARLLQWQAETGDVLVPPNN